MSEVRVEAHVDPEAGSVDARTAIATVPVSAGSFTARFSPAQVKRGQNLNLILDFLPACSPWTSSITVGLLSSDPSILNPPAQAEAPVDDTPIGCLSNFKAVIPVARPGQVGNVTATVTYRGAQSTAVLTVLPAGLSNLTITPAVTTHGVTRQDLVQLDSPVPTGGTVVQLTGFDSIAIWVPSSLTVPAGQAWTTVALPAGSAEIVRAPPQAVSAGAQLRLVPPLEPVSAQAVEAGDLDSNTACEGCCPQRRPLRSVSPSPDAVIARLLRLVTVLRARQDRVLRTNQVRALRLSTPLDLFRQDLCGGGDRVHLQKRSRRFLQHENGLCEIPQHFGRHR